MTASHGQPQSGTLAHMYALCLQMVCEMEHMVQTHTSTYTCTLWHLPGFVCQGGALTWGPPTPSFFPPSDEAQEPSRHCSIGTRLMILSSFKIFYSRRHQQFVSLHATRCVLLSVPYSEGIQRSIPLGWFWGAVAFPGLPDLEFLLASICCPFLQRS